MREIKFRAWLKDEQKMVDVPILIFRDKKIKTLYGQDCLKLEYNFNEIELLEFTGFKDKNGIEIYEGDIVRYAEFNCPVLWSKDLMWCIDINNGFGEELLSAYFDYELEVIGNIYENPDLLTT